MAIERINAEEVAVLTSSGDCAIFNHMKNSWKPISQLTRETVVDVARVGAKHALFWKGANGHLFTGLTTDFTTVTDSADEGLKLTGRSHFAVVAGEKGFLMVAAVEGKAGDAPRVMVCCRTDSESSWTDWEPVVQLLPESEVDVDLSLSSHDGKPGAYLVSTDRVAKEVRLFAITTAQAELP